MRPRPLDSYAACSHCEGHGVDPKNRKRNCPECKGSKIEGRCKICRKEINGIVIDETETYCNCYSVYWN